MKKPISILMSFLLSLSFVFATACGDTSSSSSGAQNGSQISIGANGNWFIDGVDTGVKAAGTQGDKGDKGDKGDTGEQGAAGSKVSIGENGNWFIDDVDTGIAATGDKGEDGAAGSQISVGTNGNWFIDDVDTGIKAAGEKGEKGDKGDKGDPGKDGSKVTIGENGNWFIDGVDTGVKASCDCTQSGGSSGGDNDSSSGGGTTPTEYTPIVRFAVASDIHLREYNSMGSMGQLEKLYQTAYDYADEQTVYDELDGIFMVGDAVNYGTDGEYRDYFNFVKANTRSTTVERTVMGNHEYSVTIRPGGWNDTTIQGAIDKFVEKSGYESEDAHLTINGFHFIFLSMDRYGSSTGTSYEFLSDTKLAWLRTELDAALEDDATGEKPIFVFQHVHAKDTVKGSSSADGKLRALLNEYPNVVDFSGHTHRPITDPHSIWQEQFTALNTGSMAYLGHPIAGHPTYDTSAVAAHDGSGEWYSGDEEHATRDGGLYYICEVDANNVMRVITYDTFTDSVFGEPMYIDSFGDPTGFDYLANRQADSKRPTFTAGSEITVSKTLASDTRFSFPQATGEELVQNYRIEVYQGETLVKTEYRLSGCHYGNAMAEVMNVQIAGLKANTAYKLKVYGVTYWGKETKTPLEKEFTTSAAPTTVAPDIMSAVFEQAAVKDSISGKTLIAKDTTSLALDADLNAYVASLTRGAYLYWGLSDWYSTMKESFSVELYVKVTALKTNASGAAVGQTLAGMNEYGGFSLSYTAAGEYAFTVYGNTAAKAAGDIGEWVHLVGTYDKANSVIKLYLNGEMVSSSSATTAYKPPSLTAQFFAIGADSWTEDRLEHYSNTSIAGCGVYSYALTAEQVAALYQAK